MRGNRRWGTIPVLVGWVNLPASLIVAIRLWTAAACLGAGPGPPSPLRSVFSDDVTVPLASVLLAIPITLVLANLLGAAPGWVAARARPGAILRSE